MIQLTQVTKRFGDYPALHGIDLAIEPGEFVALLGPSGSGKTTLLRIIAGLERQDGGAVLIDGQDVSDRKVSERGIGFVFQHYALFRHMSVAANVGFGLTVRRGRSKVSRRDVAARAEELLRLVQLDGYGPRFPAQLSGGQRQRVALARALAIEPRLLLLDEPFGALDAQVRKELRRALRDLHQRMGLTSIFVTHDQEEALELADRIVVMRDGRIEQAGTPDAIYEAPASAFVSHFVGETNVLPAALFGQNGGDVHVRPHELGIVPGETAGSIALVVLNRFRKGAGWRIEGRLADGGVVELDSPADAHAPSPGETIHIAAPTTRRFEMVAQG